MMKIVKNEELYVVETFENNLEIARSTKIRGLCLVYMIDDKVYSEYVKGDGTTIPELIGCLEIMRTELVEAMRT